MIQYTGTLITVWCIVVDMEAKDAIGTLEVGDEITINTHSQTFTVTKIIFDGNVVEIEGPRGGEKSLVQNVNSGRVEVTNSGHCEGEVTEIN